MSKVTGLVLAVIGFGAASYIYMTPEAEHATSEKLASLVRIAAEGSRPARSERRIGSVPAPSLIADQDDKFATSPNAGSIVLAQSSSTRTVPAESGAGTSRAGGAGGTDSTTRKFTTVKPVDDEAKRALAKSIQLELKRVGCFDAEIDGAWNQPTRSAMKSFIDRINATLPINEPDYILLTLLQGHQDRICGKSCPTGQLLANDGRCQPKAIVAQADRRVPKRDPAPNGQVIANAQVAINQATINEDADRKKQTALLEANARAEAERQAQLRIAEDNRSKAQIAIDDARRRQEQQVRADAEKAAKAELDRQQQARLADERRLKAEMTAEEARRQRLAMAEQQRVKAEAQQLAQARLVDEQRQRAEATAEDARRKRLVNDEQQRSKAEAQRLAQERAVDEKRLKAAAFAEDARRRQLVLDEQQRSKAETQQLAQARIADEQRLKKEAAAEEARRRQLVAQTSQQPPLAMSSLGIPKATQPATPQQPSPTASVSASNTDTRATPFITGPSSITNPATGGSATASSSHTPVGNRAAGTSVASTEQVVTVVPVTEQRPAPVIADDPKAILPGPAPVAKAPGKTGVARGRADNRLDNQGPAPRQQPRYVQRFIPPPYYVGRGSSPTVYAQPRAVYAAPASSYRSDVFNGLSRHSP